MHRYEPKGPNTETYYKKRKNQQCFFTIKLRLKNHRETIDHTKESWKKDDIDGRFCKRYRKININVGRMEFKLKGIVMQIEKSSDK